MSKEKKKEVKEKLAYIWRHKKDYLFPFLISEALYWVPVAAMCVYCWVTSSWVLFASFWAVYVVAIPALPI